MHSDHPSFPTEARFDAHKKGTYRDGDKWKAEHVKFQASFLDLPMPVLPFADRESIALRGVRRTPRVVDLINLVHTVATHEDVPVSNLYLDVSQTIGRNRLHNLKSSGSLNLYTVSQNTDIYSYELDRALCAEEIGNFLGMGAPPIRKIVRNAARHVGDIEMRHLFANAMSIPHIGAVITSVALSLPGVFRWNRCD